MIRTPARLIVCAAAALAWFAPLAAQNQPGGFSLPQPTATPTPTRAPAGPEDERAGIPIPPRNVPAPPIEPAPVVTSQPAPRESRQPLPSTRNPARASTTAPAPISGRTPNAAPPPAEPAVPLAVPAATPDSVPLPQSVPAEPVSAASPPAKPAPSFALPLWWPWAGGGLAGLAALGAAMLLLRRRTPKVLRLAASPPGMVSDPPAQRPAIDPATNHVSPETALTLSLDVVGATRSVMMFTLQYRLSLANRAAHAVSDISVAVELACARRGAGNAASPGAAQQLETIARIGPHQTVAVTGEVQLPLSQIAPLRQGNLALFIPMAHVTLEGNGQPAFARSFVIGTPSAASTGRLHPIRLDVPPGSILDLRAQSVTIPATTSAAVSAAA